MKNRRLHSIAIFVSLIAFITTAVTFAGNRKSTARRSFASPAIAPPAACTPPGVSLITDASGDTGTGSLGTAPGTPAQDITEVLVAEPNLGDGIPRMAFTMRVVDLTALPTGGVWRIYFNVGATQYFVSAINDAVAGLIYTYGTTGATATTLGPADSGSMSTADKTFTIVISNSKVGNPTAGSQLTAIYGRTQTFIGTAGTGATPSHDIAPNTVPTAGGSPTYTLIGSASCPSAVTPTPTPTPTPSPTATPTPTPGVAGPPRFSNYTAPLGMGENAGEPSIGINWNTEQSFSNSMFTIPNGGTSMYFGGFMTAALKVTFSDCSSPAGVTWDQKALITPNAPRVFGDPILFTDSFTGRTFVSQLLGLTPAGSTTDITDNDGTTFTPSQGANLPSDVDHQTFGGGPAHTPLNTVFNALPYKHPVYYASQSVADARAARSDDGGFTFGPGTLMYTVAQCAGLHGHIKVAPDGTVYVPNKACGGTLPFHDSGAQAAVIVSEDNGVSWNIRPVPGSTSIAEWDSSVGIATDGTIYLGYQGGNGHAYVAVSHDKGVNWSTPKDVGVPSGSVTVVPSDAVENMVFAEMVAGDGDQNGPNTGRASFAFIGTTTSDAEGGSHAASGFSGVWYLYVASTFDGGQTWITQNVTPGDPVQRGGICKSGTCRNLLDFMDASIDKEGRVLVGGEDGCIGSCIDGPPNSYTAKAFISRQTGGKRMYAQFDPVEPALPGAPLVTGFLNPPTTANLSWPTPDNAGSPITGYNIYKSTSGGPFALIASTQETNFVDTSSGAGTSYRVTALNGSGEGPYCHDVAPAAGPPPRACVLPGILTINDVLTDGQNNDFGANMPPDPSVNVRQLFIGEPITGKLVFTINVGISPTGSAPPQSQWYIIWNKLNPNANFDRNWVGMKTSSTGAITFEYGNFGVPLDPLNPNPNGNMAVKVGDADSGSYNPATGEIRITVSNSKLENIAVGQTMTAMIVRTFLAKDPNEAKAVQTASDTTDPSHYDLVGNAACQQTVPFVRASSRMTHGPKGPFEVPLPLTGDIGIECRTDGTSNYTMVFTFANPLTSVAGATITGGSGTIASSSIQNTFEYVVNLTGVANAQRLTVNLTGINDTAGNVTPSLAATMGVLIGDTTADTAVNSGDISQTKSESGHPTGNTNYREDLNVDGDINSGDISLVKSRSGTALP
jgi:hypothetical protein